MRWSNDSGSERGSDDDPNLAHAHEHEHQCGAVRVIGGIVTSIFLTLLVLPSVYSWFVGRNDHPEG